MEKLPKSIPEGEQNPTHRRVVVFWRRLGGGNDFIHDDRLDRHFGHPDYDLPMKVMRTGPIADGIGYRQHEKGVGLPTYGTLVGLRCIRHGPGNRLLRGDIWTRTEDAERAHAHHGAIALAAACGIAQNAVLGGPPQCQKVRTVANPSKPAGPPPYHRSVWQRAHGPGREPFRCRRWVVQL